MTTIRPTSSRRRRRIQDSVHKTIEYSRQQTVILELLRTRELRRLRDIKQLGLAHLVYPAAEHSRFAHAVGASHVAIRYGTHLADVGRGYLPAAFVLDDAAIRDHAVAALCHDLGHGPFSHAWERDVLGIHFDRARWIGALGLSSVAHSLENARWHEIVTIAFLSAEDGQVHQALESLEPGTSARIAAMLTGDCWPNYSRQLISSDVDADRGDYLVRDSRMTGLVYGNIDLDRLIDCSYIAENDSGELVIAFESWRAASAVADFLQARAALYESVYFHKTIRAAEGLMGLLMKRLAIPEIADVYRRYVGPLSQTVIDMLTFTDVSIDRLMHLHDRSVWTLVEEVASLLRGYDLTAQDLAQRLLARNLPRMVDVTGDALRAALRSRDFFPMIETAIQGFVRGAAQSYYVVDDARTVAIGGRRWGGYFLNRDGRVVSFSDDDYLREAVPKSVSVEDRLFVPREAAASVEKVVRSLVR